MPVASETASIQFSKAELAALRADLTFPSLLCLVQIISMIVLCSVLLANRGLALRLFESTQQLNDYIPILWRFSRLFIEHDRAVDFHQIFPIYVGNIVIQVFFLPFFAMSLLRKIDFSAEYAKASARDNLLFVFVLGVLSWGTISIVTGPYELNGTGFFSNGLFRGNYLTGVYVFCFVIPISNLIIYCLFYARFGPLIGRKISRRN